MTSITPGSNVNALLRAQLDELRVRSAGRASPQPGARAKDAGPPDALADAALLGSSGGFASMSRSALARLKAIAEDDPERPRKAFRLFLESTLLKVLGEGLQNDDSFPQLVEQVLVIMENDVELRQASQDAAEALWQMAQGSTGG